MYNDDTFLLIPCGGTTVNGIVVRRVVKKLMENNDNIEIFNLAPYLAKQADLDSFLEHIPTSNMIIISGCSECCPNSILKKKGINAAHIINVNSSVTPELAETEAIQKINKIMAGIK